MCILRDIIVTYGRPFAGNRESEKLRQKHRDESGEIIADIRQLSTALEGVVAWLGALPGPVTCPVTVVLLGR